MRILFFSSHRYDEDSFRAAQSRGNRGFDLVFQRAHLDAQTAPLAAGFEVVCPFVNDSLSAEVLAVLAAGGTRLIALRSAGFNHVDLAAAQRLGLTVVRVPAYSPHAVAEHVVGTGQIGQVFARIMAGFGCRLLAFDPFPQASLAALGVAYVPLPELLAQSDVVSLHCPLTADTHHLIDAGALASMKTGAMLINTSRGGLVDSPALVDALKSGQLGHLGLDVYEEEADLFFEDRSADVLQDDVLARLLSFPNVIVTAHQAFFTREALAGIADTTLANVAAWAAGAPVNVVSA
jgi:D-lactate dehydrogenase